MKVSDIGKALRRGLLARKLRASGKRCARAAAVAVVAGGMVFSGDAHGIEAVTNGSFENPSPEGWDPGFGTYSHTTSQVYYEGPAPAGAGEVYGWDPGIDPDGSTATQVVNLAQGASLIDAGSANYDFSAWLSSWTGDSDYAVLSLEWFSTTSGTGTSLGTTITFDGNDEFDTNIVGSADASGLADAGTAWTQDNWTLYQSTGTIPVGARSAAIVWDGESVTNNGNDAYVDLVSLDLPFDTAAPFLELIVNRDTGVMQIQNNTGADQDIKGYSIVSQDGSLVYNNWLSIDDNYDGSGNSSVDSGEWVEFSAAGTPEDFSEGALGTGTIADGATLALSTASGGWLQYYKESAATTPGTADLSFEYLDGTGALQTGTIQFEGSTQSTPFEEGDLTFDGSIDSDDWLAYVGGLGVDFANQSPAQSYRGGDLNGDGVNNHSDFLAFRELFEVANGTGSFEAMLGSLSVVPEPTTTCLALIAGIQFVLVRRR